MIWKCSLARHGEVFPFSGTALNFCAQGWDRVDQPLQTRSRPAVAAWRSAVAVMPNLPVMLDSFARIARHNYVAGQKSN
jgi:hypothetical protein